MIKEDPAITISSIASEIGLSKSGVQYAMDTLKKKGILRREGATKKGSWILDLF